MSEIMICGKTIVVDDDNVNLFDRRLSAKGSVDGVPVDLEYFVPWADQDSDGYTWYPDSPVRVDLSLLAYDQCFTERADFDNICAWAEQAYEYTAGMADSRHMKNYIFHSRNRVLPDGFHVREGYITFRLSGVLYHSSGCADFPDYGHPSLWAYHRGPDGEFIGEDLYEAEFCGADRDTLADILEALYAGTRDAAPESYPEAVAASPELMEKLGELLASDDPEDADIVIRDDTCGNGVGSNNGAYLTYMQFRYSGEHQFYIREWCSCDGDLRPAQSWRRVSSGEFLQEFISAVLQNAKLERYFRPDLADLANFLSQKGVA